MDEPVGPPYVSAMKRWPIAALCLTLAACDKRAAPLIAYRHPQDVLASILPLELFGIYRCATQHKDATGEFLVRVPIDQCYKMLPPRRFQGVWLDRFEGSLFLEGAHDVASAEVAIRRFETRNTDYEWLDYGPNAHRPALPPFRIENRLLLIDFVGRRTAFRGRYGHMGMSSSEILVDRLISARVIQ